MEGLPKGDKIIDDENAKRVDARCLRSVQRRIPIFVDQRILSVQMGTDEFLQGTEIPRAIILDRNRRTRGEDCALDRSLDLFDGVGNSGM